MESLKLFLRLSPYIQIRWKLTGLAYLCTIASLLLNLSQPFLLSYLIDHVLIGKNEEWLAPILLMSASFAVVSIVLSIIRAAIFKYLCIRHTIDLRDVVLAHIRKIPLTQIEKYGVGKFSALMGWDTYTMGSFINMVVVEITKQWFTMMIAIAMIFYMDWRLGVFSLLCMPILIVVPRLFFKPISRYVSHVRMHNEEVGTHLYESIQGSREIRAFGLEAWEDQRNQSFYKHLVKSSTKETLYMAMSGETSSLVISLIIVLIYGFGSGLVLSDALTIGMLVASIQYLNNALNPIQVMNDLFGELKKSEVAMSRIEEFLQSPIELPAAVELTNSSVKPNVQRETAIITCRNLQVDYEGTEILRGIDFTVKPGQIAAFVGRSGSGKTTLFKTLMGFLPKRSGELKMGQLPLEQWSRSELTQHLGMVFQESFLFAGTIYENIALGNLSATEEEIYDAACQANLKSHIDSLPNGLFTRIDNQGFQLSGGQRQRIAIARVILKNPQILILDEPTSALDRETEGHVFSALKQLMKNKTTLVSTHRLDTMMSAHVIYVMDQGRIVDFGTHAELLGRCSIYAALTVAGKDQMEEKEWAV